MSKTKTIKTKTEPFVIEYSASIKLSENEISYLTGEFLDRLTNELLPKSNKQVSPAFKDLLIYVRDRSSLEYDLDLAQQREFLTLILLVVKDLSDQSLKVELYNYINSSEYEEFCYTLLNFYGGGRTKLCSEITRAINKYIVPWVVTILTSILTDLAAKYKAAEERTEQQKVEIAKKRKEAELASAIKELVAQGYVVTKAKEGSSK